MEDEVLDSVRDDAYPESASPPHANGSPDGAELRDLLTILGAMRDGDFSVRLPGDWDGLWGKIADTFNEIVASNDRMAQQLDRVGQVVGKRRQDQAARPARLRRRRLGRDGDVGQLS